MIRALWATLVAVALAGCVAAPYAPAPQNRVPVQAPARGPELPSAPAPTPPAGAAPEVPAPLPEIIPPPPPPSRGATASLLESSRQQVAAGNLPLATASLERALRINPRDPSLWLELGRVKLRQADFLQAESMARRAASVAGSDNRWRGEIDALLSEARRGQGR